MDKTNTKPIKEVVLEKTYDSPIEKVWEVWTMPEKIKKWWGPNDVTIPDCEVDLKVGGKYNIVMEAGEAMGPNKGTLWPMVGQITVIKPNSQLSYDAQAWTEGDKEETMIDQTTEVTFTKENDKTKVKVKAVIHKTGSKAGMAVEGMQYGFTQQLEKLGNFLAGKK